MGDKIYNARIKHKRDTSANWTSSDPVLLDGEIIIVDTDNGVRTKTGDGEKKYTQLPFDDEFINAKIDQKLDKSGGTMTGDIDMSAHDITGASQIDADTVHATSLKLNGVYMEASSEGASTAERKVTITGTANADDPVRLGGVETPTEDNDAANKLYADTRVVPEAYFVTLLSSGWTGSSAPYSQTVSVSGILATDTPFVMPIIGSASSTAVSQQQAWNLVSAAESIDGSIIFTCFEEKPETDIRLKIEVAHYDYSVAQNAIPNYIETAATELAGKINAVQQDDSITFIAAADAHQDVFDANTVIGNKHAGMAMKTLRGLVPNIDFACFLGDYTVDTGTTTLAEGRQHFAEINAVLKDGFADIPQFRTPGECDGLKASWLYNEGSLQSEEIYSYVGKYNEGATYGSTTEGYCYRDFTEKKLRVFCLNTSVGGQTLDTMGTPQLLWFARMLRAVGMKTGWGVVVLSHYPPDFTDSELSDAASTIGSILYQYVTGGSFEVGGMTISYKNCNKAKIYGVFHGHTHNFKAAKISYVQESGNTEFDVMRIATPNMCYFYNNELGQNEGADAYGIEFGEETTYAKTHDTANDTSFVVNVINPTEGKIHSFCYGAGYDREITIPTAGTEA